MSMNLERHSDDDSTVRIPCEAAGKVELPGSFDCVESFAERMIQLRLIT